MSYSNISFIENLFKFCIAILLLHPISDSTKGFIKGWKSGDNPTQFVSIK